MQPYGELVDHLTRTTPLSPSESARVVAEVLTYFNEPTEQFVRRRHAELQSSGLTNDKIFTRILAELPLRRVSPPELTARQLRRIIYG